MAAVVLLLVVLWACSGQCEKPGLFFCEENGSPLTNFTFEGITYVEKELLLVYGGGSYDEHEFGEKFRISKEDPPCAGRVLSSIADTFVQKARFTEAGFLDFKVANVFDKDSGRILSVKTQYSPNQYCFTVRKEIDGLIYIASIQILDCRLNPTQGLQIPLKKCCQHGDGLKPNAINLAPDERCINLVNPGVSSSQKYSSMSISDKFTTLKINGFNLYSVQRTASGVEPFGPQRQFDSWRLFDKDKIIERVTCKSEALFEEFWVPVDFEPICADVMATSSETEWTEVVVYEAKHIEPLENNEKICGQSGRKPGISLCTEDGKPLAKTDWNQLELTELGNHEVYMDGDGQSPYKLADKFHLKPGGLACTGSLISTLSKNEDLGEDGSIGLEINSTFVKDTSNLLYTRRWYSPEEYCYTVKDDSKLTSIKVRECHRNPSQPLIPLKKCCPRAHALNADYLNEIPDKRCVPLGGAADAWIPSVYSEKSLNSSGCIQKVEGLKASDFRFENLVFDHLPEQVAQELNVTVYIIPRARVTFGPYRNETYAPRRWRLLDNGSFFDFKASTNHWSPKGRWRLRAEDCYCVDQMAIDGAAPGSMTEVLWCSATHVQVNRSQCSTSSVIPSLYISTFFIAVPFLASTIGAYVITWKAQNIHGWTMLSHLVTLLLTITLHGISHWMSEHYHRIGDSNAFCRFIGVTSVFFYTSCFLWLTCINFDLWWIFRNLRTTHVREHHLRYYMYAGICTGIPLILVVIGVALDSKYGVEEDSDCLVVTPNFGYYSCYASSASEGAYIYFPLMVLMVLNSGFFFSAVWRVYQHKASTKNILNRESVIDKEALMIFVKMFVVMGASCTLEFLGWAAQPEKSHCSESRIADLIIGILNYLVRSVVIFFIFGYKKKVIVEFRKILEKWGFVPQGSTDGVRRTSSAMRTMSRTENSQVDPASPSGSGKGRSWFRMGRMGKGGNNGNGSASQTEPSPTTTKAMVEDSSVQL